MSFRIVISSLVVVVLCLALAVTGWGTVRAAERFLVPEIQAKARSVALSASALVERALAVGVPLDALVGVDDYFYALRGGNPDIAGLTLQTARGEILASAGAAPAAAQSVRIPVRLDGVDVAAVHVAIDPAVISKRITTLLVDVAFIGIVAVLIALELVVLVIGGRRSALLTALERRLGALRHGDLGRHAPPAGAPTEQISAMDAPLSRLHARYAALTSRASRQGDEAALAELADLGQRTGLGVTRAGESLAATLIRPALFLFMLAEELTRPFLPRYAEQLAGDGMAFSVDVAISLPIVAFMAVVALCQVPFAGLSERLGRRRGFLIGGALAAVGYALAAWTGDYTVFITARMASALGYALVFVSAQGHVVDHSRPDQRAQGLAVFVRAIMVAALCGPPLGGLLADRVGDAGAFLVSAGVALLAVVVAAATLPAGRAARGAKTGLGFADVGAALRVPRLTALLLGCAFPAKFLLASLTFYLLPVELLHQGYGAAEIGRLQMIYPIIMVLAVPVFAALADRLHASTAFVATGGLIAGGGALLLAPLGAAPMTLGVVLLLLGVGQAMSIAPQSALVADIAGRMPGGRTAAVLGVFRLVERSGNAAGPAVAGVLLAVVGFAGALAATGAMVVVGAAAFAVSARWGQGRDALPRAPGHP